ncbi:MAG: 3-deoxy-D-manno-oct-2-ulosonic acid (Kdo) hydroxylase [Ramlibacter sp.]|nr:3-deoxy-D-manno-oct-2-ulosonic acid (Kdo) hydroxylase [Ramlibacter sp.]
MEQRVLQVDASQWKIDAPQPVWVAALEDGKVLYFPKLSFALEAGEQALISPSVRDPKSRNISLDAQGLLKGAQGDAATQAALASMLGRFRQLAQTLIESIAPRYAGALRLAPTSYRPEQVSTRAQSWRADDRRLHVDAFPSRPNRGERILRVFTNVNPAGEPRVWQVGEPFEAIARTFLPRATPYSPWKAKALNALHITKSLRSEYDHLMLQLHDAMKRDAGYQRAAPGVTMPFPSGCVWVCFSDQTPHAVTSGQYMLEQTLHLPVAQQYDPATSPLQILTRLAGHPLV